jgi:hypothetical protein
MVQEKPTLVMNVGDTYIGIGLDDWLWEFRCTEMLADGFCRISPVRRLSREEVLDHTRHKIRDWLAKDANVTPQRISKKTNTPIGLVLEALGTMDGKEIVLSRVKGKWFARLKR